MLSDENRSGTGGEENAKPLGAVFFLQPGFTLVMTRVNFFCFLFSNGPRAGAVLL